MMEVSSETKKNIEPPTKLYHSFAIMTVHDSSCIARDFRLVSPFFLFKVLGPMAIVVVCTPKSGGSLGNSLKNTRILLFLFSIFSLGCVKGGLQKRAAFFF